MQKGHKSASRMLEFALTLGNEAAWAQFTALIYARLTVQERAALAFAALNGLDDDQAYMTASVALFGTLNGEATA